MISCSASRLDQQHSIPWLLCHWNCCMYTEKPAMFQQIEPADCEKSQEIAGHASTPWVSLWSLTGTNRWQLPCSLASDWLINSAGLVEKSFHHGYHGFEIGTMGYTQSQKTTISVLRIVYNAGWWCFFPPLWKIWVRHLGWLFPTLYISKNKIHGNQTTNPPTRMVHDSHFWYNWDLLIQWPWVNPVRKNSVRSLTAEESHG